jgi:hypothetical protein
MLQTILKILEKFGRKKVLVDFFGNVMMERYFVFYNEEPSNDKRLIAKFPNLYIHTFKRLENPDGAMDHTHPWNFYSYIISGGYTEFYNGKEFYRKKGSFRKQKHDEVHQLIKVDPDTYTVFIHGFRKGPWLFKPRKCETICETCKNNFGKCYLENKQFEYDEFVTQFDMRDAQWRAPMWMKWTPELEKKLERRRKAIKKIAMVRPTTPEEKVSKVLMHSKKNVETFGVTDIIT